MAPEVLNLYALTAFAGWAHFVFAWRGQWMATMRLPSGWRFGYWALVTAMLGALSGLRALLGAALFSALVWIWFVGHFVKAEVIFAGPQTVSPAAKSIATWRSSYQPVVAFAWLSLVLFNVGHIQQHRWFLFAGCLLLGSAMLAAGGWQHLSRETHKLPAVALFFLGESLVWGTYGPYMTPAFRIGVYVFHVAGASFFHYLGSYAYGRERTGDRWLRIAPIVSINLILIFLGWAVAAGWPSIEVKTALNPIFGVDWFTLWVALHLAGSDLLPIWKRRAASRAHRAFPAVPNPR